MNNDIMFHLLLLCFVFCLSQTYVLFFIVASKGNVATHWWVDGFIVVENNELIWKRSQDRSSKLSCLEKTSLESVILSEYWTSR